MRKGKYNKQYLQKEKLNQNIPRKIHMFCELQVLDDIIGVNN